ncbi:zinc ribbon domain-containing protein [Levilactobacillus cerevisiae]|uniref:zinc ribbon domain-containing protein n=1 Tax=Levilactobacillus cerevisiae TaxID=1704076 RepID=UPI0013DE1618|nr:zinc ribbon domain-containing protein [Levilactobacillus cerevisiae]
MATELKFCPHCGAAVTADDDVCPQCQTDLRPYRQAPRSAASSQKLNLTSLYSNPYREGMKRMKSRDSQTPAKPKKKWHWPWSKE